MLEHNIFAIDFRVNLWEGLQRADRSFDKKGTEAQFNSEAFLKFFIAPAAQVHHRAHVNFIERGQHGCTLFGFQQTLGNGAAPAGHTYPFFTLLYGWGHTCRLDRLRLLLPLNWRLLLASLRFFLPL